MIGDSFSWKDGDLITFKVKRAGKSITLKGNVVLPKEPTDGYASSDDNSKKSIRDAWLRGK